MADQMLAEQEGALARRDLVPTEREAEAGSEAPTVIDSLPVVKAESGGNPLRSLGGMFMALNPRGIAGDGAPLRPLIILGLLGTLGSLDILAFSASLFAIKGDFQFDFTYLAVLSSLTTAAITLSGPIAGYAADRLPRVWMLRIGALITHGSMILVAVAPSAQLLVVFRFLGGFGPGIQLPATQPLLRDYYPVEKQARVLGFFTALSLLGGIAGGILLVVVILGAGIPWRVSLLTLGCLSTAIAMLLFLLREPVRGAVDRRSLGLSEEAVMTPQRPAGFAESWRASAGIKTLRKIWYATPFLQIAGGAVATLTIFIGQQKLVESNDPTQAALLALPWVIPAFILTSTALSFVLVAFATPLADRLLRYRPGRIMAYFGLVQMLGGLSLAVLVLSPAPTLGLVFGLFMGGLAGVVLPAQQLLLLTITPARIRGFALQSIQWWSIPGLIVIPVITSLAQTFDYHAALWLLLLYFIGGVILISSSGDVDSDIRNAVAAAAAEEESVSSRTAELAATISGSEAAVSKLLICRDLDVEYGGAKVLFNVDFDVEQGELVAILGTNGAGKSTLLRAIAGIQEPSQGAIFLGGEDITHKPPHLNARDGVVYLPGGQAIFPTLTVEENLATAGWLYKDDPAYLRTQTETVKEYFPVLRERWRDLAGNLSGGEQQQVALGQAFLMRPRLLMIDELSLGLAPAIVERLLQIVADLNRAGTTVILVEQSLNVALTIARRAVFMDKGKVRFDGSTEDLLRRPDLVRAVFLGGTASNTLSSSRLRSRPAESERMLHVSGVEVAFGGRQVLTGVDLDVNAGEIVGLIGPNGAGKTTLLDVISGFVAPDAGSVRIQATDVTKLGPDARARLGLARSFQNTRLFPSLTVRENIAVSLERRLRVRSALLAAAWAPPLRQAERRAFRRVDNLIELLGLGAFANKFIAELSTGSRRMVELACMTAVEPRVLLLDEPSSGLAQAEVEALGPVVQRLVGELGCAVVVIEHDMPLITAMSHRLLAMELGRVIADGSPSEVLANPQVVASYLSASPAVLARSGDAMSLAMAAIDASQSPTGADK